MNVNHSTSMMAPMTSSTTSTPLLQPMNVTHSSGSTNPQNTFATWPSHDVTRKIGGQILMSNSAPPLITELSTKKVTEHKKLFEVYMIQSQGQGIHACGHLASDARRFLAILCKAHGTPDYSDLNLVEGLGLSSAEWYKRVLSILHTQFPSEREERNLKLRSVAGFMQWVTGVTKYYEETNPSYEQALRIVLDGLSSFEQEQGLLRNAMVQRARNHKSCTREDIIFEVTSILHYSSIFDRKRPHEESKNSNSNKRMTTPSASSTPSSQTNQHSSSNFRRSQQNYRNNSGGGSNFRHRDQRNDGPYNRGHGHFPNRSGQTTSNTNHSTHSSSANSNSANSANSSSSTAGTNNQQNYQKRFNSGYQGKPYNNNQGGGSGGAAGNGQSSSAK
jgi:hypothetical protein